MAHWPTGQRVATSEPFGTLPAPTQGSTLVFSEEGETPGRQAQTSPVLALLMLGSLTYRRPSCPLTLTWALLRLEDGDSCPVVA